MVNVVIIEKNCKKTSKKIKIMNIEEVHKYVNLKKKSESFQARHCWKIEEDKYISVYCKDNGRSGSENKYELPRPIDEELYFGKILLICHNEEEINNENCEDLSIEEWEKIYDNLMGGEESLGDDESFSDEEEIPEDLKTKNGYMKDGFVVDESDEIEYEDDDDDMDFEEESEESDNGSEEETEEEEESDEEESEEEESEEEENEGSELGTEYDTDESM